MNLVKVIFALCLGSLVATGCSHAGHGGLLLWTYAVPVVVSV